MYVLCNNTIYTSVAVVDGRMIDGNSGHDLTDLDCTILGEFFKARTLKGKRYEYYRKGQHIYQLNPEGEFRWFCALSVADAMLA
jgi:hypothetical protein